MRRLLPMLLTGLILAAGPADAAGPCLGVDARPVPDRLLRADRAEFIRLSVPPLEVDLDPEATPADSAYVHELLEIVVPSLTAVLGPPDPEPLSLSLDGGNWYSSWPHHVGMDPIYAGPGHDDDEDGRIDEDRWNGVDDDGDGRVDEDPANSPYWDSVLIHELAHAFQRDLLLRSLLHSWFVEGCAEACEYLVAAHAQARTPGRNLTWVDWPRRMASADMLDVRGEQVLGGSGPLIHRFDAFYTYRAAGPAVLAPVLAARRADPDGPHPLAALAAAVDAHHDADLPYNLERLIDSAWRAPVDGVHPPSRWITGRGIANLDLAPGLHFKLVPRGSHCALNTDLLMPILVEATGWSTAPALPDRRAARAVGLDGVVHDLPATRAAFEVPPLPPGAYHVTAEAELGAETADAEIWLLFADVDMAEVIDGGATAVMFVGAGGAVVDPPGWTVNGRVLARVPGGAVVAPWSALDPPSALVFDFGGGLERSVSVFPGFGRALPLFLDDPDEPAAWTWSPYRPAPGETLRVRLARARSALGGGLDAPVCRLRFGLEPGDEIQAPLSLDPSGLWTAALPFPDAPVRVHLVLEDETGSMGADDFFGNADDHPVLFPAAPDAAAPVRVRLDATRLRAGFDRPVAPADLRLEAAPPGGAWSDAGRAPIADGPATLVWALDGLPASGGVRLVRTDDDVVLFSGRLGRPEAPLRLLAAAPAPNPLATGLRWAVELDAPATCRFSVHDLRGRAVHGPVELRLPAGAGEVRWDGRADGRPLPAGTYLLRLEGAGHVQTRPVTVLPRGGR